MSEPEDKSDYITVYRAVGGWQSVLVTWEWEDDKKKHGFWEPWQTGMGPYATKQEAIDDAKSWAASEEVRYVPPKEEHDPENRST